MATTVTQAEGGKWWVNIDGQWKMYDPYDPTGSDLTPEELLSYRDQYGYTDAGGTYTPPAGTMPTPPDGGIEPPTTPPGPGLPSGITPPPTGDYAGFAPYTAWTQQLGGQGLQGQSPYQQWMQNQFGRVYSNWLTRSLLGYEGMSTEQTPPWGEAPTYWGQGANTWQNLMAQSPEGVSQQFLAGNPRTAFGVGLGGARAGGAPAPLVNWLGGQYEPMRERWEAFGQPGMPGTTGQSWLEWLGQNMGIR